MHELNDKLLYASHSSVPSFSACHNKKDETSVYSFINDVASKPWDEKNKSKILQTADQYCADHFSVFGIRQHIKNKTSWHRDPKTGKQWPLNFWADIDIRDGFIIGGPKFVWEANRLYSLNTLGLAYRLTNREKYAAKYFDILSSWLEANSYPKGVNWTSGIELSVRVANLIWGLSNFTERGLLSEERKAVSQFAWLHGRHLYRYPSKYSSNNNHAIAEAFGLFLIGAYFPEFEEAKKWLAFGRKVLDREAGRQILPDGGSYEYTTTYLSFVFDFFLLYKLVCEKHGLEYDKVVDHRLEKSCEYIYSLMDSNGNIANIGDQDSAILVDFGLNNHENFQSALNTGAVLYDRPEFVRPSFPDFKTCALLGRKAKSFKHSTNSFRSEARKLEDSGLGVIRDLSSEKEILFVGNATPLGMPPLYAHGHLDAASFWLSVDGKEILVDPGTYLYHSGGKWRRYFRSTAAHNTVRIDGRDFTEQTGDFMFGKPYRITLHELKVDGEQALWQVGHDAYERLKPPVKFVRSIQFLKTAGQFIITDRLNTAGNYLAEIFFHLHPECNAELDRQVISIRRDDVQLIMQIDPRLTVRPYRGSDDPLFGWFSQRFNHKTETTTIVCNGQLSGSVVFTNTITIH